MTKLQAKESNITKFSCKGIVEPLISLFTYRVQYHLPSFGKSLKSQLAA